MARNAFASPNKLFNTLLEGSFTSEMVVSPSSHSLARLIALYALFHTVSRSALPEVHSNDQISRRELSGEPPTPPHSISVLPVNMFDTREVNASWLNRAYTLLTAFFASASLPNTNPGSLLDSESAVRNFLHEPSVMIIASANQK